MSQEYTVITVFVILAIANVVAIVYYWKKS